MRSFILIISFCSAVFYSTTGTPIDTVKQQSARVWIFTPRFNTLNMAPVSGNIVNQHVNFDFSLVYTNNRFMWTVQDAVDLEDFHSEMNYLLTNVRYKVNLTRSFSFSPFLAFYSEHTKQLIDPVSDANGGMLFTVQQGPITLEAFVLFVKLTHKPTEKDLINRFEIKYKIQSLLLSLFAYQNTEYFDNKKRMAFGFKATLPEFRIFKKINARAEITGSFKITESPETKNLSGTFLSLAFPFRN